MTMTNNKPWLLIDVDIDGVVARKMAYNASRPHRHGKAY